MFLVLLFIAVLLIDNILPFLLAKFYPNYNHKDVALSVLGSRQSPVKWIYNVWCVFSGIVFCVAPYVLYKENGGGLTVAIWILLAIYGIGCEIISGFCPLNENKQFEESDIEQFVERLETLYPETEYVNRLMTHSWGQKVVRFYDPDGNLIEVGTPV